LFTGVSFLFEKKHEDLGRIVKVLSSLKRRFTKLNLTGDTA